MKYFGVVILISTLLSCNTDNDKDRLNQAHSKIVVIGLTAERIYKTNKLLIDNDSLRENLQIFERIDDTLQLIRDELISTAGGYTETGQFMNLPASSYVDDYFYKNNSFRNNSHEFFFKIMDDFVGELKELYPNSDIQSRFDKKYKILKDYFDIGSREMIFKNLTLNEAVILLELIREDIAIEQTEFLIRNKYGR